MSFVSRSKQKPISGARIGIYAFTEDEEGVTGVQRKMVGRGSGFNNDDNFGIFPLNEMGDDGVEEYEYGQHGGAFTIPVFIGENRLVERYLPNRSKNMPSFHNLPALTIQKYLMSGPNKGKILETYRGCKCSVRSGAVAANGIWTGTTRWVYTHRDPGEDFIPEEGDVTDNLPVAS